MENNNIKQETSVKEPHNVFKHLYPSEPDKFLGNHLDELLVYTAEKKASDVFIRTNDAIRIDLYGLKYQITGLKMDSDSVTSIIKQIYGADTALSLLSAGTPINTIYVVKRGNKSYRYRVNIIRTESNGTMGYSITMRSIPSLPPLLDKSDIPQEIIDNFNLPTGLILVVGSTGSGKSTLISGIIRDKLENQFISKKIISFEAPIEFVYTNVDQTFSFITQTEIPSMLPSFKVGVEESLRCKPDDIFIGEMRDTETIINGINVSQMGHLVYSTMHVNSVAETIKRVANMFTGDERQSAVFDILQALRLVISQRLKPTPDGKRVAIREYLILTDEIRTYLISQDINQISHFLAEQVWEKGIPFIVHARQRYLNGEISENIYKEFKVGISKTDEEIDAKVYKFREEGHVMFLSPKDKEILQEKLKKEQKEKNYLNQRRREDAEHQMHKMKSEMKLHNQQN